MNNGNRLTGWSWKSLAAMAVGLVVGAGPWQGSAAPRSAGVEDEVAGFLYRTNYHGWADSIWISNGKVEAIVVPSIGRVMQLRFAGEEDGPFWENAELAGQPANPGSGRWMDFGGNKVWPSPQSGWSDLMETNWPPPVGFDGTPARAEVDGWVVTLVYPDDPHYGIRMTRQISLPVDAPSMEIVTRFVKTAHPTLDVGTWVVTQLKEPLALYARLQLTSLYPQGFQPMSDRLPPSLSIRNRLLKISRDERDPYKIGLDVGTVLWMTEDTVLRIDSPRLPYRTYPDKGASAEISTHPDPLGYVAIEMLSPVRQLRVGGSISHRTAYTLLRRTEVDPDLEAAKLLKL